MEEYAEFIRLRRLVGEQEEKFKKVAIDYVRTLTTDLAEGAILGAETILVYGRKNVMAPGGMHPWSKDIRVEDVVGWMAQKR